MGNAEAPLGPQAQQHVDARLVGADQQVEGLALQHPAQGTPGEGQPLASHVREKDLVEQPAHTSIYPFRDTAPAAQHTRAGVSRHFFPKPAREPYERPGKHPLHADCGVQLPLKPPPIPDRRRQDPHLYPAIRQGVGEVEPTQGLRGKDGRKIVGDQQQFHVLERRISTIRGAA